MLLTLVTVLLASALPLAGADANLAPFLHPPAALSNRFGAFRSPLLFTNGTPVRTASDWPRRRAEILHHWQAELGPWPPLLTNGTLTVLREETVTEPTPAGEALPRVGYLRQRVSMEISPGRREEGWLLRPPGPGPFPAVLVVFYEPDTSVGLKTNALRRDFARQLTRRGFVTLSVGTPGGNAWKPALDGASCQPLSFHAFVAANLWHVLARLPQVDAHRIGVTGHSYGGKWALFAAAFWERFAAVAVSDPGIVFDETRPNVNYWEPWYLGWADRPPQRQAGVPSQDNPRTGAYRRLVESGHDLHEIHALLAPRPFLVSGGSEDPVERWEALNHLVALNRLLGREERVAMTTRPTHDPTEESNAILVEFFERFLR